ncbi:DUF7373 family lipoprotein [[Mycobacterium] wendilense]|uniref:ABC transporter substrate-binding protein n=1 Tax=[Mycobacterium] wendilense TaxID=3064284 RepID=A0ABN9NYA0_9MYCO|nr:hypothetical protein [Mycolicibacterium sp. MU0050]CAJ1582546.1 hypothetical protein MU0050_002155 [Mycolicibacterium sp. MU0050]
MGPSALRAAVVAAVALLLAGCATVHSGTAIRDPRADPRAVNTALLDPGDLLTTPRPPLGTAGDRTAGALLEARRMAEFVVLPFEVDPGLNGVPPAPNGPVVNPDQLGMTFLNSAIPPAVRPHDFVTAFQTSAGTRPSSLTRFTNIVLRFATPENAAAAARAMGEATLAAPIVVNPSPEKAWRAVPREDRPEVLLYQSDSDGWSSVRAFTAHGPYVLAQLTQDKAAEEAIALALSTVDKQRPALDRFVPTAVDQLATLPADPTGLIARSPVIPEGPGTNAAGVYGPHAALNFMHDPVRDQPLFEEVGLQWMLLSMANVYRTRDDDGARRLADGFATQMADRNYTRAEPVSGMPASRCFTSPKDDPSILNGPLTYCLAPVDADLIEVSAPQPADAHQLMAAQYLMLVAP